MAEPIKEQIAAALEAAIEAIAGDGGGTYWYSYNLVTRVVEWEDDDFDTRPEHDTVCFIKQGITYEDEKTSGSVLKTTEFFCLVGKRWTNLQDKPEVLKAQGDTYETTIQNRLTADIEKCCRENIRLADLTWNLQATEDSPLEKAGWVLGVVRILAKYDQAAGTL